MASSEHDSGRPETAQDESGESATREPEEAKEEPSLALQPAIVPIPNRAVSEFPQAAFGLQLMMQRSSLERLEPDIQVKVIGLADDQDRRGFEFAKKDLEDRAMARKQALVTISAFALLVILAGGVFSWTLLSAGEFDKAYTLIMAGVGVVGALLGGAGLQPVFKQLSGR